MSTILYSFKCPVAGCTQVVTIESNDETDALNRLVPAVQEHVSTAHAGVPLPGNLEDLVRTSMYQGGSGSSDQATSVPTADTAAAPSEPSVDQPGVPADTTATPSTPEIPSGEPALPSTEAPGSDVSSQGTYAPNPTVEVPADPGMPSTNPSTVPSPEPMGGEMQPEVPAQTPEQPATSEATGDEQTNQ